MLLKLKGHCIYCIFKNNKQKGPKTKAILKQFEFQSVFNIKKSL